jgi:hypothetical protein
MIFYDYPDREHAVGLGDSGSPVFYQGGWDGNPYFPYLGSDRVWVFGITVSMEDNDCDGYTSDYESVFVAPTYDYPSNITILTWP